MESGHEVSLYEQHGSAYRVSYHQQCIHDDQQFLCLRNCERTTVAAVLSMMLGWRSLTAGSSYFLSDSRIAQRSVRRVTRGSACLVLGRDAFLAPLLNSRKPVLEGVHVAWRSACHSFDPK